MTSRIITSVNFDGLELHIQLNKNYEDGTVARLFKSGAQKHYESFVLKKNKNKKCEWSVQPKKVVDGALLQIKLNDGRKSKKSAVSFLKIEELNSDGEGSYEKWDDEVGTQWEQLLDWVAEEGGVAKKDEFELKGEFPERGVFAQKDFKKGDVIFKIPEKCCLSHSEEVMKWCKKMEMPGLATEISLVLELRKGSKSGFAPWTQMLGELDHFNSFHPAAIFLKSENRKKLEEACAKISKESAKEIVELADGMNLTFEAVNKAMKFGDSPLGNELTREEWVRSCLCLRTRGWTGYGFVPVADMMNSSTSHQNVEVDVSSKSEALVRCTRDIKAGDHLLNRYCVTDVMSQYIGWGFVENNVEKKDQLKKIVLTMTLDLDDVGLKGIVQRHIRQQMLEFDTFLVSPLGLTKNMARILRTSVLNEHDYAKLLVGNIEDATRDLGNQNVSLDNELRMIRAAENLIKEAKSGFGPGDEEAEMECSSEESELLDNLSRIVRNDSDVLDECLNSLRTQWSKMVDPQK
jgi:hypothetical protein